MQQRLEIYTINGLLDKEQQKSLIETFGDRMIDLLKVHHQPIPANNEHPAAYCLRMYVSSNHSDMVIMLPTSLDQTLFRKAYLRFIERQRIYDVDQQALKDLLDLEVGTVEITPNLIHRTANVIRYFGACLHHLSVDERPVEFISLTIGVDRIHIRYRCT